MPLVTAGPKEQDIPFLMADNNLIAAAQFWFESSKNTTIDNRPHSPIPNTIPVNPNGTAPMLGLQMDDYLLGSLLYSLTQNGVFNWHLDDGDLPAGSFIQLNTALFAAEWPALYQKVCTRSNGRSVKGRSWPPLHHSHLSGLSFSLFLSVSEQQYHSGHVSVVRHRSAV
jgi:hypothetical protein